MAKERKETDFAGRVADEIEKAKLTVPKVKETETITPRTVDEIESRPADRYKGMDYRIAYGLRKGQG